jgi:hypothetical protein
LQGTLADHPAEEPLVFDGNLYPSLATVSVANADTKPEDGRNPAHSASLCRDKTAKGRSAADHDHTEPTQKDADKDEESWEEPT